MQPEQMTADQVGALFAVVGYAILFALSCLVVYLVGMRPWRWLWRELRGATNYFVKSYRLEGYGRYADGGVDYVNEDEDERPTVPGFAPGFETVSRGVSPREIRVNSTETPSSDFFDPADVEILARLVHRGVLGKTDAIKIGLQRESGARYQAGKAALDAALMRLDGRAAEAERDARLEQVAQQAALRH